MGGNSPSAASLLLGIFGPHREFFLVLLRAFRKNDGKG